VTIVVAVIIGVLLIFLSQITDNSKTIMYLLSSTYSLVNIAALKILFRHTGTESVKPQKMS
jgi:hypothetical protein